MSRAGEGSGGMAAFEKGKDRRQDIKRGRNSFSYLQKAILEPHLEDKPPFFLVSGRPRPQYALLSSSLNLGRLTSSVLGGSSQCQQQQQHQES